MSSKRDENIQILQGTLDLLVLRTLDTMGAQHAYAIATRLEQVSGDSLHLNQGTLYPALIRLEQQGLIKGAWGKTENGRDAKYYSITRSGRGTLAHETLRWRRLAGLVEKVLTEEC
jgi:transcriptional regulator